MPSSAYFIELHRLLPVFNLNRLLFFVLLAVTGTVAGQPPTRADKVQAVLRAMEQSERTINQKLWPTLGRQAAPLLVRSIGAKEGLGAGWRPGNSHWIQAEAVIIADLGSGERAATP